MWKKGYVLYPLKNRLSIVIWKYVNNWSLFAQEYHLQTMHKKFAEGIGHSAFWGCTALNRIIFRAAWENTSLDWRETQ
jgi:hypothetical protein